MRCGIIGTGTIGTDLLIKSLGKEWMEVEVFSGRRLDSPGMQLAASRGVKVTTDGIKYFIDNPNCCDVVYDCTNSLSARRHAEIFSEQNLTVLDLTPAKVGDLCVPSVNASHFHRGDNVNMITCGGQAALPLLCSLSPYLEDVKYIEMVSQIASKSAGIATRINIDDYIETTEFAIKKFTGTPSSKVIINLNPAEPCVDMQTTIFIEATPTDLHRASQEINKAVDALQRYIPGYNLTLPLSLNNGTLAIGVRVRGSGDYLPPYAGNLDIITCAAIETTRLILGGEFNSAPCEIL